eukprot:Protomagalhaensia_wolfi_Nauph_80__929@NODE_1536_length_1482_cov_116_338184_g1192_i0_p1_GENE_NODE_1536_length_1482_cov_116_338184_g1192_i0NODE_1536_length_1482_cov_116_338184_g1192_i0_p1_ORF_typecomplete_len305_score3_42zfCHY/PF05495_12/9_5e18zfCHY/PF05495_12/1_8e04zfC3HC4/PF00097_25/4_7e03zfC3HC4/PF00097_25/1_8e04zfC3HC4/PF00097_25/8_9e08zfRING_UBOX/PF13445_6/6_6e03zfRING_UBOX/PF13445_6/1_7e04zfRING_UBOX/PF13445_6/1_8e04zfRING_UBOX/PF13445_6/9_2e08zfC3HC4_2/PF13923_6/1_4e04zfC3HC4_2/PF13923_6/1_
MGAKRALINELLAGSQTTSNSARFKLNRHVIQSIFFSSRMLRGERRHVRIRRRRTSASASSAEEAEEMQIAGPGCKHYSRRCRLVCSLCNIPFPCRFCHDDVFNVLPAGSESDLVPFEGKQVPAHKIDRHSVREVICCDCDHRQPVAASCAQCTVTFGQYFCRHCCFFDDDISKKIWHCDKCGLCRVGGQENYFHCDQCDGCYPLTIQNRHKCLSGAMRGDCPICLEPMFDSRKSVTVLERCGHTLHVECFQEHRKSNYDTWNKCPLCLCVHTPDALSPATTDEWHTEEEVVEEPAVAPATNND